MLQMSHCTYSWTNQTQIQVQRGFIVCVVVHLKEIRILTMLWSAETKAGTLLYQMKAIYYLSISMAVTWQLKMWVLKMSLITVELKKNDNRNVYWLMATQLSCAVTGKQTGKK